jgi:DNA-binding response OmpR family regulator
MQILVVEDDHKVARIIKRSLEEDGDAADVAHDSDTALDKFSLQPYDLIILDLLIPGEAGNGIELCKKIRQENRNVSILMLTALDSVKNKVAGLDAGADDYLTKPFNLTELSARVRALLRRTAKTDPVVLVVEDLMLDTATHQAKRGNTPISLTTKEYALLHYLMRAPERVINQTELIEHVWDYNYQGLSNIVETYIRYLRKKLSPNKEPQLIHTMRGSGYWIGNNHDVR